MTIVRSLTILGITTLALAALIAAAPAGAPGGIAFFRDAPKATALFVGDMFFDRHIRLMMERHGADHVFSCLDGFFDDADLVIGNLEGPVTDSPSVSVGTEPGSPDNFRFTFPPETAALLARHGIDVVNLGNNHLGNFGLAGVASTKHYLAEAGVDYFGGLSEEGMVYRTESGGVLLSFVSYNEFGGPDAQVVAERVAAERAAGHTVVVYAHWGEEYMEPPPRVRAAAELFAQAGALLIIGSHPHVVLGSERVGGALVYWSLGNFIFDQYWNEEVSRGLAVEVTFGEDGTLRTQEHPVEMLRDGRTCPIMV